MYQTGWNYAWYKDRYKAITQHYKLHRFCTDQITYRYHLADRLKRLQPYDTYTKKQQETIVQFPADYIKSDPVGIRTQDPQLRRLLLYPAELPDRAYRHTKTVPN